MSDNDNRDLFDDGTGPKNALLDELDSLKDLLREQEQATVAEESNNCDPDIPMLDDVVDIDAMELAPSPEFNEAQIPVLEEVAFPVEAPAAEPAPPPTQSDTAPVASSLTEQELGKLVDMLVGHRLRRLRPKIKEEVLEELQRLYPELFR